MEHLWGTVQDLIPRPTFGRIPSSTLRLINIRTGDEGNYTCVVSNILGNNSATFMLVIGECHGVKL